jgi:hypothetical protein
LESRKKKKQEEIVNEVDYASGALGVVFYVPSGEAASAEARVPAGLVLWSRLMREA